MAAFTFDKCCCCIDLKIGCFIIAYFSLISYILLAITSIALLAVGGAIIVENENAESQEAGIVVMVLSVLLLIFTLILLTFIIVLLVGLHKNKPKHVKAYLIYACVYLVVSIVVMIGSAATSTINANNLARNIISILFSIYFILVIRSQYFVMKSPERGPAIYSANPKV